MNWRRSAGWLYQTLTHPAVRTSGRAIRHTSGIVHRLLVLGLGAVFLCAFLAAGVAWRLGQGPIELNWLAKRLSDSLQDQPVRVSFDSLALVWEGFHRGADLPLDIRVENLVIADATGRHLAEAPAAHVTFSPAGLVMGRLIPRTIEIDNTHVSITRDEAGAIGIGSQTGGDTGGFDPAPLLRQLFSPAGGDRSARWGMLEQVQRVHIRDSGITFHDQKSGIDVVASGAEVNIVRLFSGRVAGSLHASLAAAGESADLAATINGAPGVNGVIEASITPFRPSRLSALAPPLAALDLPVSASAAIALLPGPSLGQIDATVTLGEGSLVVARGTLPIQSGKAELSGTPDSVVIRDARAVLMRGGTGVDETASVSGTITHVAKRLTASLKLDAEQIDIADLPKLWPQGVADNARDWVTAHVLAGTATKAEMAISAEADDRLDNVEVTSAVATVTGEQATFTWLDNVPPVTQAHVDLHLRDPDDMDISISGGRQHVKDGPDIAVDGNMTIVGLTYKDQSTTIHARASGPLLSAFSLLAEPRLRLLSVHPVGVNPSGGDAVSDMDFDFPLEKNLSMDDVGLRVVSRLRNVSVNDVVAGMKLSDGTFLMDTNKDGLTLKGTASLADNPITLDGSMDFRSGAPNQVEERIAVTSQTTVARAASAGLPITGFASGPVNLNAVLTQRRNGDGTVAISGDLTPATLTVGTLAWTKPAGEKATGNIAIAWSHDKLTSVGPFNLNGDDIALTGETDTQDGHVRTVRLDSIRLGKTRGRGDIGIAGDKSLSVVLRGPEIDLSAKLAEPTPAGKPTEAPPNPQPRWTVDARFDHAILANDESATNVAVAAAGADDFIATLNANGTLIGNAGFSISLAPTASGRQLSIRAADAGRFLRGTDTTSGMRGGRLTLDGTLPNRIGLFPLTATATIDDTIVRNSPWLGKLLQAITLYGLADVLRGPGMAFSHMIMPFRYDGDSVVLTQAEAFNSSLGLTATGRIMLHEKTASLSGTLVPAYFFNSLLGHLPIVGRLFSPEKGSGVFAARFSVDGKLDDPSVSINPISALTPGFLREIFGIFDRGNNEKGKE